MKIPKTKLKNLISAIIVVGVVVDHNRITHFVFFFIKKIGYRNSR